MSQSVGAARAKGSQPAPELVLPDCEAASFQYGYLPSEEASRQGIEWSSTWPDSPEAPLKLPRLVTVSIRVAGRDVHRVCAIMPGVLGQHAGSSSPP